jgi:hypothetical protein
MGVSCDLVIGDEENADFFEWRLNSHYCRYIAGYRAQRLLTAVTNTMKPVDFLETIWTRDIVDLQWDIIRFRRLKADVITYYYDQKIRIPQFDDRAKELNSDIADVVARKIDALERIDRMVMTMEARRNAAYREAERYRIGLGERLRGATEQVEDAEFREVDNATAEHERAA